MTVEFVKGIARQEVRRHFQRVNAVELLTADATPSVLFSIDTESYQNGRIKYTISGLKDDGATGLIIEKIFRFHNDGSTLTIGTEASILSDNDLTGATVAATVNGITIEIKVTGIAATNISWIGQYEPFTHIVPAVGGGL